MKNIFILLLTFTSLVSCSTRTCKPNETLQRNEASPATTPVAGETTISPTTNMTTPQNKKIKVYKPDGSIQCERGTGKSVTEMAKEFGDIKIFTFESKHDGLIRIQKCGTPTGQCNVYEISESDWDKASKLGFKKWKN
jgi:hypothetical protein